MVDRASRDTLVTLLGELAAGQIAKERFEDAVVPSRDKAVREIVAQAWLLYDDVRTNDLIAPSKKDRSEVGRWALFLKTDLEYEWPSLPLWARVLGFIPSILTFGLFWRPYRIWFERRGDWRVWPFLRDADFKTAKRSPAFQSAK